MKNKKSEFKGSKSDTNNENDSSDEDSESNSYFDSIDELDFYENTSVHRNLSYTTLDSSLKKK